MYSEEVLLIEMAITAFNKQYNATLNVEDFYIKSIIANSFTTVGYEIYNNDPVKPIKLRIYFRMGQSYHLGAYKLELTESFYVGGLGDEVYVAEGTLKADDEKFKFNTFIEAPETLSLILQENNALMLSEDGDLILLE
jgi:hypothetical protein